MVTLEKLKKWFIKGDNNSDDGELIITPKEEEGKFILKVDDINLGFLEYVGSKWSFQYTDDFKKHESEYNYIVGFPDLNKTYYSKSLWPFFLIRIPGLEQRAVQEIIKKEKLDQNNEVQLLKHFGRKTISNPYELLVV